MCVCMYAYVHACMCMNACMHVYVGMCVCIVFIVFSSRNPLQVFLTDSIVIPCSGTVNWALYRVSDSSSWGDTGKTGYI